VQAQDVLLFLNEIDFVALFLLVIVFEIPRYTLSVLSLLMMLVARHPSRQRVQPRHTITVIIPAFNGGPGLLRSLLSLKEQTLAPLEVVVVDDGSVDETLALALEAKDKGLVSHVLHHSTRCGRSPAINFAARFAKGDLLFTMDADTTLDRDTLHRLAVAFEDPTVAAASCNLTVANASASIWASLQSLEYLVSISSGKWFLDALNAVSCCSGACSMYRRSTFIAQGGLDVGPGEDLEYTLRVRRLGRKVRFVQGAWADTAVPVGFISLVRQRLRWDRDAFRIRMFQYREGRLWLWGESLGSALQRFDFLIFTLAPTLLMPVYLACCIMFLGSETWALLGLIYIVLVFLDFINVALASLIAPRGLRMFNLLLMPIFTFYQGFVMKAVRLAAFSEEILWRASDSDDYVPPRVRRALTGG
jgi:cellulose synthase/poly-beta-1,6-N-acetylglucosamine synthase-like glycosyltransferase